MDFHSSTFLLLCLEQGGMLSCLGKENGRQWSPEKAPSPRLVVCGTYRNPPLPPKAHSPRLAGKDAARSAGRCLNRPGRPFTARHCQTWADEEWKAHPMHSLTCTNAILPTFSSLLVFLTDSFIEVKESVGGGTESK